VSIDEELLERIHRDAEAREKGRSALIRAAVELYLEAKQRQTVDSAIRRAYDGQVDALLDEVAELLAPQSWPGA
jgi:metal-responsive CopG/Arc/MetJ family transcriptional regulator